jgi:class 3 adenylate cyclase
MGLVHRADQRSLEHLHHSELALKEAVNQFESENSPLEAARALLELARTQRAANEPPTFVRNTLLRALDRAEQARLDPLVEEIERELETVIGAEYWRRFYYRSRGRGIPVSMAQSESAGEEATIVFVDIENYSKFALSNDPKLVLGTLNQIFWILADVLQRHQVTVNQHLGDGFMAFARHEGHAHRAVEAGLELLKVIEEEFNRPRRILEQPTLEIRIGIATGFVVFGNVGTFYKMDYTAVGETTNLAARLQSECQVGSVCISGKTFDRTRWDFRFREMEGRMVEPKNFPRQRVWDVVDLNR